MAKYFLSNKAVSDLSDIWGYTYETWSERQADKYYSLLLNTCKELAKHPDMGKRYESVFPDLRGCRINQHIVFYLVREDGIFVVRILHGGMDLKSRLNE
ncbi:MAG: type II toxin-antitoxin system RelE/ParE family toxin [Flavipsychrobacter sp.]|nr:type II toxin-antitoxin system RelE/ParE family toxin [Flavipsychrobacter sp.]